MSVGLNYNVWIIIGATRIGIKGRCTSRVAETSELRRWCVPTKAFNEEKYFDLRHARVS
jgi:hypothetical protein